MKDIRAKIESIAVFFTDHYLLMSLIMGIGIFILLTIQNPELWYVSIIAAIFFGWIGPSVVGLSILGIGYALIFLLFPIALLYTLFSANKSDYMELYSESKEGIFYVIFVFAVTIPCLFLFRSCDTGNNPQPVNSLYDISVNGLDPDRYDGEQVYICTGGSSKKYHRHPECKGLRSCSKNVEKVYQTYAEEIGRTPCKLCYKKM